METINKIVKKILESKCMGYQYNLPNDKTATVFYHRAEFQDGSAGEFYSRTFYDSNGMATFDTNNYVTCPPLDYEQK